ncbi:MAG: phosphoenolpyruvate--protein phosphotransferase [Alphaproteobacteria bacterium]
MNEPAELVLVGTPAAPGLAHGVVHILSGRRPLYASLGVEGDREALTDAIATASAGLGALIAEADDDDAAGMLTFQLAMLEDETLTEPAFAGIAGGAAADQAWVAALAELIADFAASDDANFAARAADLIDLRDRVLDALCGPAGGLDDLPAGAILVSDDLTPSRFLEVDWSRAAGMALRAGSRASHVAILARGRGIPMVVGLGDAITVNAGGADAWLDADQGRLIVRPAAETRATLARRHSDATQAQLVADSFRDLPAVTRGGRAVTVYVNLDDPDRAPGLQPVSCDGVGLARSEFLFERPDGGLPDEAQQFAAYAKLLRWADGRPVTIRTLDAGGDKPIAGLTDDREANPFLGLRGLRLSLARPDVFAVQARALLRAATVGRLKVMLPMVTAPHEIAAARAVFFDELGALNRSGTPAAMPALGMMVEVPAAALAIADFDVDFYSIGTNDLIQYVCAVGRDNDRVAALYDPTHPAVLRCLAMVAAHGARVGREVSLCGDMASDPAHTRALLECGIHVLSVTPAAIARVKQAVAALD